MSASSGQSLCISCIALVGNVARWTAGAVKLSAAAWVCAGVPVAVAQQPRSSAPELEVEQVAVIPGLPRDGSIAGVVADSSGALLVYFSDRAPVLLSGGGSTVIGDSTVDRVVGVGWAGDGTVEVVDGPRHRVVRFTEGRAEERAFGGSFEIESAVRLGGEWIVGGRASRSEYRLRAVRSSGDDDLASLPLSAESGPRSTPPHLTSCGPAVLVTEVTAPQKIRRWSATSGVQEFELPPLPQSAADAPRRWVSAPAVCLGEHVLQTLIDITSDRRVFVVYGPDGRMLRTTEVDTPLAFVASIPGHDQFVAIRRISTPELVVYRWRWTQEP